MHGDNVIRAAAREFEVPHYQIVSSDRRQHVARARIAAMWCIRRVYPDLALAEIGRLFGGRHHTTVLYALAQADARRTRDGRYAGQLERVVRSCRPTEPLASELDRRDPDVRAFLVEAGI